MLIVVLFRSCNFAWAAGEWEECSATCGERGVQERQLFCVPANMRYCV